MRPQAHTGISPAPVSAPTPSPTSLAVDDLRVECGGLVVVPFQVCSRPAEADPASHQPSQHLLPFHGTHVVLLQHEQPPDLDVLLVNDAG